MLSAISCQFEAVLLPQAAQSFVAWLASVDSLGQPHRCEREVCGTDARGSEPKRQYSLRSVEWVEHGPRANRSMPSTTAGRGAALGGCEGPRGEHESWISNADPPRVTCEVTAWAWKEHLLLVDVGQHPEGQRLEIVRFVDPLVCAAWDLWPWADDEARVGAVEVCEDGAFNSGLGIAWFGAVVLAILSLPVRSSQLQCFWSPVVVNETAAGFLCACKFSVPTVVHMAAMGSSLSAGSCRMMCWRSARGAEQWCSSNRACQGAQASRDSWERDGGLDRDTGSTRWSVSSGAFVQARGVSSSFCSSARVAVLGARVAPKDRERKVRSQSQTVAGAMRSRRRDVEITLASADVFTLYPGMEADGVPLWRRLQLAAAFHDMGLSLVGVQEA